jgi:hypothetical protein
MTLVLSMMLSGIGGLLVCQSPDMLVRWLGGMMLFTSGILYSGDVVRKNVIKQVNK